MPIRDTTHRTSRKRRTRGSTMVESALVMLAFTMLLVAIFDVSQFLFMHQSLVERVRVAARWAPYVTPLLRPPSPTMFCTANPRRPPGNGGLRAHVQHGCRDDHGCRIRRLPLEGDAVELQVHDADASCRGLAHGAAHHGFRPYRCHRIDFTPGVRTEPAG